jgi:YD repeat-containing protein
MIDRSDNPRTGMTLGSGLTRTRCYDFDYRLSSQVVRQGTSAPVMSLAYSYDADDNVAGRTDSVVGSRSTTYSYDQMDRLLSGGGESWSYDPAGRRKDRRTTPRIRRSRRP